MIFAIFSGFSSLYNFVIIRSVFCPRNQGYANKFTEGHVRSNGMPYFLRFFVYRYIN